MTPAFALNLPERRRKYRFALTPLADAMFQLLIFFMLSSGFSAYALLDLRRSPAPVAALSESVANETAISDTPARTPTAKTALWSIEANGLRVGGQRFSFDALDALAVALGAQDQPASVVLILRPSAQVQDIATVLASLSAAKITSVQITAGRSY